MQEMLSATSLLAVCPPSFFFSTFQRMLMNDTGPDSKTSEAVGTIRGVATEDQNMTHRNVHASEEHPRYEVRFF